MSAPQRERPAVPGDPLFTAAFHRSPIGQYLLAPTPALEILAVNDAFLASVARRRDEVLGKPLFEAFPSAPGESGDVGTGALARSIADAIATGEAQLMAAQHYPIEMERDGRRWFEDMYWSATNTPVYDEDGTLVCVSHTTIDITARVLAQRALQASEEQARRSALSAERSRSYLAGVLQAAPVAIMMVDRDGTLLHNNPSSMALFGAVVPLQDGRFDFPQWRGWFGDGARSGEQLGPADWPLQRALHGETVDRCLIEVAPFGAGEMRRIVLVSAAPVRAADGELVGATSAAIDIEDRIRAEQALLDADRRKDEFLAMLAHELRNPLAPIGAAASILALGGRDAGQMRRTSEVITRQVRHMSDLIDELLDVARVTRGMINLSREPLDAKRVVAEALEQTRPAIEARRHTLHLLQPPMAAFVDGDRKRLVQVLANLLGNAAKFTPEGGEITVELAVDARHVRMAVSDNGAGLSPDMLEHAFDLFVQADRTSDRRQGGLGIGLALVRSLVALHGGTVTAHSDGPGRGARFVVCLPQSQYGAAGAPRGAAHTDLLADPTTLQVQGQPLSILIVEDNQDALTMLTTLVGAMGHRVHAYTDPLQALAHARRARPDVCLLDIGLPGMDGMALARALRADPVTAGARLIAMSGYGQESDRAAALAAGFDEYHVKPIDLARLGQTLAGLSPGRAPAANDQ